MWVQDQVLHGVNSDLRKQATLGMPEELFLELFYDVDDSCRSFLPIRQKRILSAGEIQHREGSPSMNHDMSILILF